MPDVVVTSPKAVPEITNPSVVSKSASNAPVSNVLGSATLFKLPLRSASNSAGSLPVSAIISPAVTKIRPVRLSPSKTNQRDLPLLCAKIDGEGQVAHCLPQLPFKGRLSVMKPVQLATPDCGRSWRPVIGSVCVRPGSSRLPPPDDPPLHPARARNAHSFPRDETDIPTLARRLVNWSLRRHGTDCEICAIALNGRA